MFNDKHKLIIIRLIKVIQMNLGIFTPGSSICLNKM